MAQQRMIIASFPSSAQARQAAQAMATAGFNDVHIRRNSRFGVATDENINDPVAGNAESLSALTLYSVNPREASERNRQILLGADPSVSGYSARGYGLAGGEAFILVAFVAEPQVDQAVMLLKQNGGEV